MTPARKRDVQPAPPNTGVSIASLRLQRVNGRTPSGGTAKQFEFHPSTTASSLTPHI